MRLLHEAFQAKENLKIMKNLKKSKKVVKEMSLLLSEYIYIKFSTFNLFYNKRMEIIRK